MAPLSVRDERILFEQRLREEARAAAEQIPVRVLVASCGMVAHKGQSVSQSVSGVRVCVCLTCSLSPHPILDPKQAKEAAWEAERKKPQPDLNVKWIYAYVLVRSAHDRHKQLGVRLLNGACAPRACLRRTEQEGLDLIRCFVCV